MSDTRLNCCPFCQDTSPRLVSGPCTFTSPDMFMAQVECTHCCAKGTHMAGEESLEQAEQAAIAYWNEAGR